MTLNYRTACLLGFLACVGLMGYALYAQHVLALEPCPLCILQRIAVIATGIVFLAAFLHGPRRVGRWIYGGLAFLTAIIGAGVASRHVWLQSLPADQVPACGPGYDYMMETFPFMKAMEMIFRGSGECAEVDWTFLGLSMPVWTLMCFLGLALWGILSAGLTRKTAAM
jgi:disulfide bond formation protein DsbB